MDWFKIIKESKLYDLAGDLGTYYYNNVPTILIREHFRDSKIGCFTCSIRGWSEKNIFSFVKTLKGFDFVGFKFPTKGIVHEKNLEMEYFFYDNEDLSFKLSNIHETGTGLLFDRNINTFIDVYVENFKENNIHGFQYTFNVTSPNINNLNYIIDIIEKELKNIPHKNCINVLMTSDRGKVIFKKIGNILEPLIKENYETNVIKSFDYVCKNLDAKVPKNGRFVIINGPPGTGKTYFVKGVINALQNPFIVLIPTRYLPEIDGPNLLSLIMKNRQEEESKCILFVIEDADAHLVPRGSDNIMAVSSLLNLTDGILGEAIDIRIIATTNANKIELDEALTRPGRLLKRIEINKLNSQKASEVYYRLTNKHKNFNKPLTLAEIYAFSRGKIIENDNIIQEKKIGF